MSKRSPNDIDRLVGARLRSLRTVQDRTLAELGTELGISHQQLQKYETGANRMSSGRPRRCWASASRNSLIRRRRKP